MTMLCMGSWKIRHDEPLAAQDMPCRMQALPADIDTAGRTVVVEADRIDGLAGVLRAGGLPLALVKPGPAGWRFTHLLLRIETHALQLIRPPCEPGMLNDAAQSHPPLHDLLRRAFADNHLYLNNFECFYTFETEAEPAQAALDLRAEPRPEQHAAAWLQAPGLATAGFRPAFADEWRLAHHTVHCARVEGGDWDAMAFLAMDDKRKPAWDSGHGRVMVRCRRNRQWSVLERSFAGDAQALVSARGAATTFDPVAPATLLAAEVRCESCVSGRIYAVRFEWWAPAESGSVGFAGYRVSIGYLKTLGFRHHGESGSSWQAELARLSGAVRTWAEEGGLSPRDSNCIPLDAVLAATPHRLEPR